MGDDGKAFPITIWYSTLGMGDGHDFATRGYLRGLMSANYQGLRLPPSLSTALLRIDGASDPDMEVFSPLMRPPEQVRMKPMTLVQAGDSRIGTKRIIDGKDKHGNPEKVEIEITEGSIDLDVEQQYTSSQRFEVRCVVIHHDPASICRHYTNFVRKGRPQGVAYVGLTVWETSEIPEAIAVVLSELDLIIVPSEHAKKAFEQSGVSCPITVVPHTFDEEKWTRPTEEELLPDRGRDKYVFYSIATPIERKNLTGLMRCYFQAFQGREDVILRIKSSGEKSQLKEMAKEALEQSGITEKRPPLRFFTGRWPIEQIRAFHLDGDCYVSATRGEGFGLPEMEARLCGSRVITTGWGAACEVLKNGSTWQKFGDEMLQTYRSGGAEEVEGDHSPNLLVDYELTSVQNMQGIGCYEPEQKWADPKDDSLIDAMRLAAEQRFGPDRLSWDSMQSKFGQLDVGHQLSTALVEARETAEEEEDDEF